jgi:hypothetical protein
MDAIQKRAKSYTPGQRAPVVSVSDVGMTKEEKFVIFASSLGSVF